MKVRFYYIVLALVVLVCQESCKPKKKQLRTAVHSAIATGISQKTSDTVVIPDESLNDLARFAAGLPVKNDTSYLLPLTKTEEWQAHARNMDQIWNAFQQTLPKLMAFTQSELSDINSSCHTLFYPFGGPDYLFSNTFFPKMDTYILIGLEHPGSTIRIKKPSKETYLLYQNAVSDILNLSFFRTDDIKKEFFNDTIDGVVPIISVLMVRSNRELVSIRNVNFSQEGDVVYTDESGKPITGNTGIVEFKYFHGNSKKVQTLYYCSTDLSNASFLNNKPLQAFLDKSFVGETATFIKSASYLMHTASFAGIRQFILDHSSGVLQDDSGIPLSFYKPDNWVVTLYGTFLKPISMFSKYVQPELREAYKKKDPKTLNFRIGYARQSNLQIARRKD
ncbi:hypothetical protein [uncultured Bacteroides sp.]|uniref:hypothetical protein n=1 Tax=uncultured Bacteroides sp. TaxID=162156 RepID=UPI002AAC087B|nr:hypothetical protein [uncultured Bacteroides sp.]